MNTVYYRIAIVDRGEGKGRRLEYHVGRDRQAVLELRSMSNAWSIDRDDCDPALMAEAVARWHAEVVLYQMTPV